jgi:hypothetical protein
VPHRSRRNVVRNKVVQLQNTSAKQKLRWQRERAKEIDAGWCRLRPYGMPTTDGILASQRRYCLGPTLSLQNICHAPHGGALVAIRSRLGDSFQSLDVHCWHLVWGRLVQNTDRQAISVTAAESPVTSHAFGAKPTVQHRRRSCAPGESIQAGNPWRGTTSCGSNRHKAAIYHTKDWRMIRPGRKIRPANAGMALAYRGCNAKDKLNFQGLNPE